MLDDDDFLSLTKLKLDKRCVNVLNAFILDSDDLLLLPFPVEVVDDVVAMLAVVVVIVAVINVNAAANNQKKKKLLQMKIFGKM